MRTYYCYSCLKASVLVVNLLVLFLGLGITGLSSWLLVSDHLYLSPSSPSLPSSTPSLSLASYLLLAIGLAVSTLAFLGCCGALTTSRCLLGLFTLLLILLTLAEVALVVLLHFKHLDVSPLVTLGVAQTVEEKYHPNNPPVTLYWDNLQQGLGCCGSLGPADWAHSSYNGHREHTREIGIGSAASPRPDFKLPRSCCRSLQDPVTLQLCVQKESDPFTPASFQHEFNREVYFDKGCSQKIVELLNKNLNYLLFAGLGILLIEVFGVIFSICLCCTIKKIDDIKA